ncbi:hypothetical protein PEC301875_30170 [Pectobacterium carotovorum subsp. carotovorum]|nr:hypothetical protein PEC301875_30170 [Pectobacterium carotovorum subsp. carotovorum]
MFKINRPFFFAFSSFTFLLTCFTGWFSFDSYLDILQLNDVIVFSWKVGLMVFGSPLLFYFSYLGFYMAIKKQTYRNAWHICKCVRLFVFHWCCY